MSSLLEGGEHLLVILRQRSSATATANIGSPLDTCPEGLPHRCMRSIISRHASRLIWKVLEADKPNLPDSRRSQSDITVPSSRPESRSCCTSLQQLHLGSILHQTTAHNRTSQDIQRDIFSTYHITEMEGVQCNCIAVLCPSPSGQAPSCKVDNSLVGLR